MRLGLLDWAFLAAYFTVIVAIGVYVSRRDRTTEDYFVGSRKIPGWALGLSILGTCISSVTYVAYPGKSLVHDWQYLVQGLMLPVLVFAGALAVVPFYRRYVRVSVNEFIELRFGPRVRLFTLFVLVTAELTRLAMVLYLVSLVIHTITGWPLVAVITGMGAITAAYSAAGGIKGVIWTDVLQTLVLFAGGLAVVFVVSLQVPGGFVGAASEAFAAGKFRLADFSPSLARPTFWVLALSGLLNFFYFLAGNQNQVQRYQCAASDAEARKAALIGALGSVPVWALFLLVGTMLFVFYQHHPDPRVSEFLANGKGDKVFPHFIATQLPSGLSGLLLAGLFAAAMSTADSSMNALSTLIVTDLYRRFLRPDAPESRALSLARWLTFAWGALGIVLALAMIRVQTFLNFYFEVVAIIGGGIAGVFALALFSRRAHARGVLAGIAAGLLVTLWGSEQYAGVITNAYPWLKFPWDPIMTGVVTSVTVIVVGYLMSRILRPAYAKEKSDAVLWDTLIN